jgi:preprotein translocase subunit YajC
VTALHLLAMASPSQGGADSGSALGLPIMMLMLFVVMWFFMIRPQKKQADQRKAMLEAIKRGDKIVTNGGIFATVRDVKADRLVVNIAENVKIEIAKNAVAQVLPEEG